ncbi:hypothetical protein IX314_001233 [Fusobacterium sp. DD26]|uniref:hypothetical protein n=1 Tax=unclassified Fusobacterium TaxID=2648384 RepID=UPI001B8B70B3|nr:MULTISPECIES: hypothetical protein [unclassified Fusobacterium]MBR8711238.1 hypothetical protein [Fusobacterium sp. DD28]MBR8751769.1 hypothetical protein [Fusobacterium sp. DD26]
MAEFNGQFITNKGRNLLNRALAGEGKIIFTGAALGVGKHTDNLKEITDLKDKKLDMNVLSVRNDNGSAVLKLFITNEKVKESFTTQEFGVYAKIEGDSTPILYSYATAIEPDTIPSNKFGTTYEAINEIYMSFVSDIDTDIQVTHGNIFMTLEVASEIFLKHGYVLGGKLKEQTQLLKDRVYSTDANEHYLNIETRSWGQVERVDNKLIKLTYKDLLNFSTSNTAQQLATLNEKVGNAIELAKEKEPKFSKNSAFNKNFGTTPGTVMPGDKYPVIEKTFAGIAGNTINPGFIQDSGQKEQGKFYLDRNTGRLYRCIKSTQSTTNTADNFQDVSLLNLSDRLDNLSRVIWEGNIYLGDNNPGDLITKIDKKYKTFPKLTLYFTNGGIKGTTGSSITTNHHISWQFGGCVICGEGGTEIGYVTFNLQNGELFLKHKSKNFNCHLLRIIVSKF